MDRDSSPQLLLWSIVLDLNPDELQGFQRNVFRIKHFEQYVIFIVTVVVISFGPFFCGFFRVIFWLQEEFMGFWQQVKGSGYKNEESLVLATKGGCTTSTFFVENKGESKHIKAMFVSEMIFW